MLACSSASCQTEQKTGEANTVVSLLFIGNSLTYTNDLPHLVAKLGTQKGMEVRTQTLAFPNYALVDHWNDGKVQEMISTKAFDFVIVQQGPSSQEEGRKMLLDYGEKFSRLCTSNDAYLCFFMVWPPLDRYQSFDAVIKNYKDAAAASKAILLPVGEVWKEHIDRTNSHAYYGADGFHPSLEGSEEAAKVIMSYLFIP